MKPTMTNLTSNMWSMEDDGPCGPYTAGGTMLPGVLSAAEQCAQNK